MTPQEQQLLDDLLNRLARAQGVNKDGQADAFIRQRLDGLPDATYLLVQRVLLLERALENAKAQLAQWQAQSTGQRSRFLDDGLRSDSGAGPAYPPPAPPPAPSWRDRLFGAPAAPARGSSFLGNAMSTAAGVAGGMFLFDGIENLLGGHRGGGLFGTAPQETVVENITNNVYQGAPGSSDGFSGANLGDVNLDDASFDGPFDDDGGFNDDLSDDNSWI